MRRRRRAVLAAMLAVTGSFMIVTAVRAAVGQAPDPAEAYLEEAARAADGQEYSGVVVVEWVDAGGAPRQARMRVRHDDQGLQLEHDGRVVLAGDHRFVGDGERWTLLADATHAAAPPAATGRYRFELHDGPEVAGRRTRVVEARREGVLVERVHVDEATSLVLRRERYAENGDVTQVMRFVSLWDDADDAGLAVPETMPRPVDGPAVVDSLDGPYRAPDEAGDGFRLGGRWRHADGLVQLYYSDGILGASVFERPGELDWSALPPGGEQVEVDGGPGRRYVLPVGETLVWERGGVVYSAIGAVPASDLAALASDVSADRADGPLIRVARVVLGPFGW